MESFNNENNNDNKRTIALEMPPTNQRMEGQSSQNTNLDPQELQRRSARRRYADTFRLKQKSRIMKLEQTVQALEANVERDSMRVYRWKRQHYLFQVENCKLKQKFCLFSHEIKFKEAECVKLKKEKDELKEVYVGQQKYEELMQSNMANAELMERRMDQLGLPTNNTM